MVDIKPYVVRYKAGKNKEIKPGIHGQFATREEAENAMERAARYFGGPFQKTQEGFFVGRAIIGIVVDQKQLQLQQQEQKHVEALGDFQCADELPTGEQDQSVTTSTTKK